MDGKCSSPLMDEYQQTQSMGVVESISDTQPMKRLRHPTPTSVYRLSEQPVGILTMILSYLTFDMHYDSISGVNKRWLSYVKWYDVNESESKHNHRHDSNGANMNDIKDISPW
jgi:hypothetical protein